MDILTKEEIEEIDKSSNLIKKYNEEIDRESAYEILTKKLELNKTVGDESENESTTKQGRKEKSTVEKVFTSTTARQVGRTVAREITRGILGVIGIGGSSRKKKTGWF